MLSLPVAWLTTLNLINTDREIAEVANEVGKATFVVIGDVVEQRRAARSGQYKKHSTERIGL
jgi:hypothetical protein